MRNVSDKRCIENQNTYFVFNKCSFGDGVSYMKIRKNVVEPAIPQTLIRRMRVVCWITKTTHTQNMQYLLLFHCNIVCRNAPQCRVI